MAEPTLDKIDLKKNRLRQYMSQIPGATMPALDTMSGLPPMYQSPPMDTSGLTSPGEDPTPIKPKEEAWWEHPFNWAMTPSDRAYLKPAPITPQLLSDTLGPIYPPTAKATASQAADQIKDFDRSAGQSAINGQNFLTDKINALTWPISRPFNAVAGPVLEGAQTAAKGAISGINQLPGLAAAGATKAADWYGSGLNQELQGKSGYDQPPAKKDEAPPAVVPAPSMQLAQDFKDPAKTVDPEKLREWVAKQQTETPTAEAPVVTMEGEKPRDLFQAPGNAPPNMIVPPEEPKPDDFIQRWRTADEAEKKALMYQAMGRSMADNANMIQSSINAGAGVAAPPKMGTPFSDAAVARAQKEKNDLSYLEVMDPNSKRSLAAQEQFSQIFPQAKVQGMSAAQIFQMAPFFEKQEERAWKEREHDEDRELKAADLEQRRSTADYYKAMKEESNARLQATATRLPEPARKEIAIMKNAMTKIGMVRDQAASIMNEMGPVEGRVQQAAIRLGIAKPGQAVTTATLTSMFADYVKSISGVAVAEPEFKRLGMMFPNAAQNPQQFMGLLDNFQKIIEAEYENKLESEEEAGMDVSAQRKNLDARKKNMPTSRGNVRRMTNPNPPKGFPSTLEIPLDDPEAEAAIQEATAKGYK